jgi:putative serine protease PepD
VLRADGYILTNNHVVEDVAKGGGQLRVIPNGRTAADAVTATVVGTDPLTDLAVIKAVGGSWSPATLGHSENLVVGDSVIAVGAPLGLRGTVTSGIVSALNRFVDIDASTAYDRAIQTDAAINPGNSGGALVNASGDVIGINSAIATAPGAGASTGNIGVGFAIPIDEAAPLAEDIIRTGKASHPYLGVVTDDSKDPAGAVITSKTDPDTGKRAEAVSANSPADKAGLREGDVITKVDDQTVTDYATLIAAIRRHRTGDSVSITYIRQGSTRTTKVTLAERPRS